MDAQLQVCCRCCRRCCCSPLPEALFGLCCCPPCQGFTLGGWPLFLRCCREGKEIRKIGRFERVECLFDKSVGLKGNIKKSVILVLTLAGLGGMALLPMAGGATGAVYLPVCALLKGLLGDVKAGATAAQSADCASRHQREACVQPPEVMT